MNGEFEGPFTLILFPLDGILQLPLALKGHVKRELLSRTPFLFLLNDAVDRELEGDLGLLDVDVLDLEGKRGSPPEGEAGRDGDPHGAGSLKTGQNKVRGLLVNSGEVELPLP